MPVRDRRARNVAAKGTHQTSGSERVTYRNAVGKTREALVLGAGTSSGLKLQIIEGSMTRRIVDNVPAATTEKSVNSYVAR